jgi:type VI secretion system protein
MIHQVALLNGIRQGISALLNHLSPDELQRSAALSRKGPGGGLLKAFRATNPWRLYLARHQELLQDERAVQSVVFGSEFAFAYAQIMGGNVKSAPKAARTNGVPGQRASK